MVARQSHWVYIRSFHKLVANKIFAEKTFTDCWLVPPKDITLCFVFPRVLVDFLQLLYKAYCDLYFTYLEINPLGESQSQLPHS